MKKQQNTRKIYGPITLEESKFLGGASSAEVRDKQRIGEIMQRIGATGLKGDEVAIVVSPSQGDSPAKAIGYVNIGDDDLGTLTDPHRSQTYADYGLPPPQVGLEMVLQKNEANTQQIRR